MPLRVGHTWFNGKSEEGKSLCLLCQDILLQSIIYISGMHSNFLTCSLGCSGKFCLRTELVAVGVAFKWFLF